MSSPVPRLLPRPLIAPIALIVSIALSACGTSGGTAPASVDQSAGSSPQSASAPAASAGASAAVSPSATTSLVLPHDDPALEARLPDELDGKKLFKISVGPVSSVGNAGAEPIKALVDDIGDGSGNFGLAFANDPTTPTFNFFALRVPGASSTELVDKYAELTLADTRGAESDKSTIGGKAVTHVTSPGNKIGDVWFYAVDDTLFGVQAGSVEQATTLLALLP